jgi:hypothetical protein
MIGFMDVIHVDEKPATGTSDLYYEAGLSPSISFRVARRLWSLTPASRTPFSNPDQT